MEGSRPRISAMINTYNEEKNLPYALRCVKPWVDEIVVVDMHSEDRTVEIARDYGAAVYFHERMGFADPARSFAIAQTTGDWILMLDADELIPAPLSKRIRQIVREDSADVVTFQREEYILGSPLHNSGYQLAQNKHTRLFKRDSLQANPAIHDFLKPVPAARILDVPGRSGEVMIHFAYLDTASFLDKMNRYSTIEANQSFARGAGKTPAWVPRDMRPYPPLHILFQGRRSAAWALLYGAFHAASRYIKNRGYRDGWRGAYIALFWGMYYLAAYAKLTELETVGTREMIEDHYHDVAEHILKEYAEAPRDVSPDTKHPQSR
ncbi:MAG: glycosyltransferase family 2 protein [Chloroflexota bacterium]|nr:glycosyltransferase family 2 protein [Chloroflexota bacterium]